MPTIAESGLPGFEAIPSTPAEFTAYIRSEIANRGKIVKAAGIKAD